MASITLLTTEGDMATLSSVTPASAKYRPRKWGLKDLSTLFEGYILGISPRRIGQAMSRPEDVVRLKASTLGLSFNNPHKSGALTPDFKAGVSSNSAKALRKQREAAKIVARARLTYKAGQSLPRLPVYHQFPLLNPIFSLDRAPIAARTLNDTHLYNAAPSKPIDDSIMIEDEPSDSNVPDGSRPDQSEPSSPKPKPKLTAAPPGNVSLVQRRAVNERAFNFNADPRLDLVTSVIIPSTESRTYSYVPRSPDVTIPCTGTPTTHGPIARDQNANALAIHSFQDDVPSPAPRFSRIPTAWYALNA